MDENRQVWNKQQKALRHALTRPVENPQVIDLFIHQHAIVHSAIMSGLKLWSFADDIWFGLTEHDIRQIPKGGEHSIA
jgi:hypothetical protein